MHSLFTDLETCESWLVFGMLKKTLILSVLLNIIIIFQTLCGPSPMMWSCRCRWTARLACGTWQQGRACGWLKMAAGQSCWPVSSSPSTTTCLWYPFRTTSASIPLKFGTKLLLIFQNGCFLVSHTFWGGGWGLYWHPCQWWTFIPYRQNCRSSFCFHTEVILRVWWDVKIQEVTNSSSSGLCRKSHNSLESKFAEYY